MKNKVFSFINIIGLSIGMAACLLILQYVSFELSYDQFNEHAADIYRVSNDRYQDGKLVQHGTITYSGIGKAMQDDFPEVVNHARVEPWGKGIVSYNTKKIGDQDVLFVDNSFLTMFSYPFAAGNPQTALQEPRTAVFSEALAKKLFQINGNDFGSLLGRPVILGNDSIPYKLTGICKDVPENSHLQFDILLSYNTLYSSFGWKAADYDFGDSDFWHYIQLRHGTDYKALEAKLPAFSQRHFQGNKISGSDEKFYLQPLSKAHLYSDFEYEIGETASSTVVWGLLIIAMLIIVIAWVNYINLATAKSMERAREVGVRKVSGATKQQLVKQFLTESFIVNIVALALALLIVALLQSAFNSLVQHQLSLSYLFEKGLNGYDITAVWIALIIGGIFISGLYPAFVLSSFKPILVLKGKFTTSRKGIVLRKGLVIGQFAITVALIIGSMVVYQQIKFVNAQDLGM
ncbi:MAG TPA: ABC transporter permease, partial [Saprospiraceae bacterium]|nr:ABC transporter permease [Saprospiraceae bacterium]